MRHLLFIVVLLCTPALYAQDKAVNFGVLQQAGEEVVFAFVHKKSNKTVLLCKEKNNKYLVYRFGNNTKVELEYPGMLDKTSWKKFEYSGYWRGGGKANAALVDYTLSFTNKGVAYELYEYWNSEDDNDIVHIGIRVAVNKKVVDMPGDQHQKWGSLDKLRFLDEYIQNKGLE